MKPMPSGQRRQEFSFQGSAPVGGGGGGEYETRARMRSSLGNPMAPREGEEESRWLQASRVGSPESGSFSGTPSPEFWGYQQQHLHRIYPSSAGISPSRAQAIAGYRREMLDLVRGLPESCYELSLRDIVESPPPPPPQPLPPPPPTPPPPTTATASHQQKERGVTVTEDKITAAAGAMDEEADKKQSKKQGKSTTTTTKTERKQRTMEGTRSRSLDRSVRLDTGLLIKLFLPLSVGGGKKKVSPKPPTSGKDGKKKKTKKKQEAQMEEEWWNKGEFSEADSSSRTNSTNSTNSTSSGGGSHGHGGSIRSRSGNGHGGGNPKAQTSRSRSRKRIGCYGFFKANKSKNGGTED